MQKVRPGRTSGQGLSSDHFRDDDKGVTFYDKVPDFELTVREFEDLAKNRLCTLHAFDRICGYDTPLGQVSDPNLRGKLQAELVNNKLDLVLFTPGKQHEYPDLKADFCRRDMISHFVLRLAFCSDRDSREWFLRQEQRLFVLRFDSLTPTAQEDFMRTVGLPVKQFDPEKADGITMNELLQATPGAKIWHGQGQQPTYEQKFYEMPFHEVYPSLISNRKVIIHKGVAYVPVSALKLILAARFKERLSGYLEQAADPQVMTAVLADPKVGWIIRLLKDRGMSLLLGHKSSEGPSEKLSLENFDEMLQRSFPPCMRRMVETQRERRKHLKHQGRLQLRPFLRACGFTIDESFKWWKQELTRDAEIDVTSFEKNYVYDVEHAYGKKGHFQGQNAFGCAKIIGSAAETAGQCHGCLFKQEMPAIKQQMHKWRVPEKAVQEMEKLINNGKHYQLACIEYFKVTHPANEADGVGNSPGDFFRESCKHHLKKKEKDQSKESTGTDVAMTPGAEAVAAH